MKTIVCSWLVAVTCLGCAAATPEAPAAEWRDQTIAVGAGDSLYVVHRGIDNQRVLVFVPGLADTWQSYQSLAAALPDTFGLILVDALGHGRSTKVPGTSGPSRQSAALRAALDSLSVQPFAVIGHSYGGVISQHYALSNSELPAVVLMATLATFKEHPAAEDWASFVQELPDIVPDEVLAGQANSFFAEVPDSIVAPYIEASRNTPGYVWREVIGALVDEDTRPQFPSWRPATLLVVPETDRVLGALPMEQLSAALPQARVAQIPHASHAPHWEHPESVAEIILTFLDSVQQREYER
jgi:pimeloyl-ACP methyl ester carboxylesterase